MVTTQVPFQGKDVLMRFFVPQTDLFDGTGSLVSFTVSQTPLADANQDGVVTTDDVIAKVDGVPVSILSIDVNTGEVILDSAPAAGTDNVSLESHYEHEPILATAVSIAEEVENIELDQLSTDAKLIAETSLSIDGEVTLQKEDADMTRLFWGGNSFNAARTKFILKLQQTRGAKVYTYYYNEVKLWTRDEEQNAGDVTEETFTLTAAGAKVLEV